MYTNSYGWNITKIDLKSNFLQTNKSNRIIVKIVKQMNQIEAFLKQTNRPV